jgi:AcrR family transcriptional regulator
MRDGSNEVVRSISPVLLAATTDTLRRMGPRQFSLTAVAEVAGVSRGTVHNAFGNRDCAIKTALNHLAAQFIETMAAVINQEHTLADQVAAAAALVCAHRRHSDSLRAPAVGGSILVLLLGNVGDDLMRRSIDLWKPRVQSAQAAGEVGADIDPKKASEWIVRMLLSFELMPPIHVNLDNPRAVRRFVATHIVAGLRP